MSRICCWKWKSKRHFNYNSKNYRHIECIWNGMNKKNINCVTQEGGSGAASTSSARVQHINYIEQFKSKQSRESLTNTHTDTQPDMNERSERKHRTSSHQIISIAVGWIKKKTKKKSANFDAANSLYRVCMYHVCMLLSPNENMCMGSSIFVSTQKLIELINIVNKWKIKCDDMQQTATTTTAAPAAACMHHNPIRRKSKLTFFISSILSVFFLFFFFCRSLSLSVTLCVPNETSTATVSNCHSLFYLFFSSFCSVSFKLLLHLHSLKTLPIK